MIEPIDPLERSELNRFDVAPRSVDADELGLLETDHRLGQSVVVRVADTADRTLDAGLGQALGVMDRKILGGFNWSSQHLKEEVLYGAATWMDGDIDRTTGDAVARQAAGAVNAEKLTLSTL